MSKSNDKSKSSDMNKNSGFDRFLSKTILLSSIVVIILLLMEASRENVASDWRGYQKKYKAELIDLAKTKDEKSFANEYSIKLQQIVLPKLERIDRCITCHSGIEDSRMADKKNPLKKHPGNYLDVHDVNVVGCTMCHDGQGRAITTDAAHAFGEDKYWEKPLLSGPFLQSTCVRCHADTLEQASVYNRGKSLFMKTGCLGCHSIGDIGGTLAPNLSNIGQASFHFKMPIPGNREKLLKKFHDNVNLAYIYEAITQPNAQPKVTIMPKFPLSEDDVTSIMVFLKSLSSERRVMDVGVTLASANVSNTPAKADLSKGKEIFLKNCTLCHGSSGKGDGPAAKALNPKPANFTKGIFKYGSANTDISNFIKKGKGAMPPWGGVISDQDINKVISYIRSLKK